MGGAWPCPTTRLAERVDLVLPEPWTGAVKEGPEAIVDGVVSPLGPEGVPESSWLPRNRRCLG